MGGEVTNLSRCYTVQSEVSYGIDITITHAGARCLKCFRLSTKDQLSPVIKNYSAALYSF